MAALNKTNPAVKRLLSELRDLQRNPSDEFSAHPLSDENLFEWHFTIRGPPDSDFEGGLYHGRILLPGDYPFKAPDIVLLTPSGRFELDKKICLSNSSFHPESWQPAWGIRTALLALRAFFPSDPEGAIGGIKLPPGQRRHLARISRHWKCPTCGDELVKVLPPRPCPPTPAAAAEAAASPPTAAAAAAAGGAAAAAAAAAGAAAAELPALPGPAIADGGAAMLAPGLHRRVEQPAGVDPARPAALAAAAAAPTSSSPPAAAGTHRAAMAAQDRLLTNVTVLSFFIILIILFRKTFVPMEWISAP